jgi:hypothetical protein
MDRSLIVKKIAEIQNELDEMFDEDKDVIQEDELGNQILPNKIIQEDDDNSFVLVTSAMAALNRDDTDSEDEDEYACDKIPTVILNKSSGVPPSICSLATFYNPDPQDEWKNMRGEAAVYVSGNNKNEAALIATMYDGNPDPKSYWEAIIVQISQISGKLCLLTFLTWNISKFGQSLGNQIYQLDAKSLANFHTGISPFLPENG